MKSDRKSGNRSKVIERNTNKRSRDTKKKSAVNKFLKGNSMNIIFIYCLLITFCLFIYDLSSKILLFSTRSVVAKIGMDQSTENITADHPQGDGTHKYLFTKIYTWAICLTVTRFISFSHHHLILPYRKAFTCLHAFYLALVLFSFPRFCCMLLKYIMYMRNIYIFNCSSL